MYTVYKFVGTYYRDWNGNTKVEKMSLEKCFRAVFSSCYDVNMKQFFERGYAFETEEKSIEEIYKDVGSGVCYFPFSTVCRKETVENTMKMGLNNIYFLRAGDYRKMEKEYFNYI